MNINKVRQGGVPFYNLDPQLVEWEEKKRPIVLHGDFVSGDDNMRVTSYAVVATT